MKADSNKTPALSTDDDPKYQLLQGQYWTALGEGNTAKAEKINEQIAAMRAGKGGLFAKLMSGGTK